MSDRQVIVRYSLLQEAVQKNADGFHEAVSQSAETPDVPVDPNEQARLVAAFTNAMGELSEADTGTDVMSTARNAIASRLQSLLVDKAVESGKLSQLRPAGEIESDGQMIALPELLEVRFDNDDWWGWIKMSHYLLFKPAKSRWLTPPEVAQEIPNDAVIAVFGDWGTGMYGAPPVTQQVLKMERCDVVLHLGDTYYAGRPDEIASRLVTSWPKRTGNVLNRTLNGNHEMYSGGEGYYTALASAPFNQSSSCVAMQNDHWLLLGLDTSYIDSDLDKDQVAWVDKMVNKAAGRRVLLFSHHQVYSQFDAKAGEGLQGALGPLLNAGKIYGWIFGHEHRLVIFDPHPQWGVKARCLGNGGFPEFRPEDMTGYVRETTQWLSLPAQEPQKIPAAQVFDGPNRFIGKTEFDQQMYVPHGFLVLEFNGATVWETYKDPDGKAIRPKGVL